MQPFLHKHLFRGENIAQNYIWTKMCFATHIFPEMYFFWKVPCMCAYSWRQRPACNSETDDAAADDSFDFVDDDCNRCYDNNEETNRWHCTCDGIRSYCALQSQVCL